MIKEFFSMRKQYSALIIFLSLSASLVEGSSDVVINQCTKFVEQAEENVKSKVPDLIGRVREVLKADLNGLHKPVLVAAQEGGIPFEKDVPSYVTIDIRLDKKDLFQKCIDAFEQNKHKKNLSNST